jgi:membrane protease YdiL (CAAX protease family)
MAVVSKAALHTESGEMVPAQPGPITRLANGILFLICGLVVFVLGCNYFSLVWTNDSTAFRAGLAALFLVAAFALRRTGHWKQYWPVAYAFFVGVSVFLVADLALPLRGRAMSALGLRDDLPTGLAFVKVWETCLASVAILGMARVAGWRPASLYLSRGNLKLGLSVAALVGVNLITTAVLLAGNQNTELAAISQTLLWGGIFALANGFLEELWLRGLFLDRMAPFVGGAGSVVVTAILFASMHTGAVYIPAAGLPFFVLNTLTLGLGLGWLMRRSGSLWGAMLIHAAADLWWFLAVGF